MKDIKNRVYRHFKGDYYLVLDVAINELSKETQVVYQSFKDNTVWTRNSSEFFSPVPKDRENPTGQKVRFEVIKDLNKPLSNFSTEELVKELSNRSDNPFRNVDIEGVESSVIRREFLIGKVHEVNIENEEFYLDIDPIRIRDTHTEAVKCFQELNRPDFSIWERTFSVVDLERES